MFRQRHIRILHGPFRSLGRPVAGKALVGQGAEGVDVGPGPLIAARDILLERRISGRDDGGYRARLGTDGLPGRPEIDQNRRSVVPDHDVRGLYVSVKNLRPMHPFQAVDDRHQHLAHFLLRQPFAICQNLGKWLSFGELHNDIGGPIGSEKSMNLDQIMVAKAGQGLGLVEEPVEAPLEILGHRGRFWDNTLCRVPDRKLIRQIFLDRDRGVEVVVEGQIGDSETAVTKNPHELIIFESVAFRQRVKMIGVHRPPHQAPSARA